MRVRRPLVGRQPLRVVVDPPREGAPPADGDALVRLLAEILTLHMDGRNVEEVGSSRRSNRPLGGETA